MCQGQGLQETIQTITVEIPNYVINGQTIQIEGQGHETLNKQKGKNGNLLLTV